MPVRLGSKLPPESEARIEIIPLIDIMFFLLASFMLVSLSMVNRKSVKLELPSATTAAADRQQDSTTISVDRNGGMFLNQTAVGRNELGRLLAVMQATNPAMRVFIRGDRDSRHGDILGVLDSARAAGIERVAFETRDGPPLDTP